MNSTHRLALLFFLAGFSAAFAQPDVSGSRPRPYTFTTLAGDASFGSADGTGSAARFSYPMGVAIDHDGSVFVADSENATIRMITADGVVTTFAGEAGSYGSSDGTGSAANSAFQLAWHSTATVLCMLPISTSASARSRPTAWSPR